jgi:hypothetical protein
MTILAIVVVLEGFVLRFGIRSEMIIVVLTLTLLKELSLFELWLFIRFQASGHCGSVRRVEYIKLKFLIYKDLYKG